MIYIDHWDDGWFQGLENNRKGLFDMEATPEYVRDFPSFLPLLGPLGICRAGSASVQGLQIDGEVNTPFDTKN